MSWENHDRCARNLLATPAAIEDEQLADRVTVVRRDGTVLYADELTAEGGWRRRPAAARVVQQERSRPWAAPGTASFRHELAHTDRRVHAELVSEDRRLAVQRDTERAATWSYPVRRIAQPGRRASGVDYHRVSPGEHRRIFDELIAPSYLNRLVLR
ncbi:hypothetical protein [Streptomyces bluensis]|uniref:hypothetical protein n=1 Tax=Streptomyces bluensis TaxID=33897 RepID=UPI0033232780